VLREAIVADGFLASLRSVTEVPDIAGMRIAAGEAVRRSASDDHAREYFRSERDSHARTY
jgi:hypothetical protein